MAPQNSNTPFLDQQQYQNAQMRLAQLREKLVSLKESLLIANPQFADILNEQVDNWLDKLDVLKAGTTPPADHGLAGLIGLGRDAFIDFGQTRVAPPAKPYDEQITAQRIQAVADLYYIYQHEMLGVFRVILKLQELFKGGVVRLSEGPGAYRLYQYDRKKVLRYAMLERMQAYLRAFGYTNVRPAPGAYANREFHTLFNTFNAEVARFFRDKRISEVVREHANDPAFGSIAIVRRAGLDLRYNLKNFSYGHLSVLRAETMQLLEEAFEILQAPDVRNLFGADTAWDVIEDVLRRYFNEHANVSPRNRMAIAGRTILRWLSESYILKVTRPQFEALAQEIAEPAEEWITSAQTIGVAVRVPDTIRTLTVPARNESRELFN
jgi:hypothetical protein